MFRHDNLFVRKAPKSKTIKYFETRAVKLMAIS